MSKKGTSAGSYVFISFFSKIKCSFNLTCRNLFQQLFFLKSRTVTQLKGVVVVSALSIGLVPGGSSSIYSCRHTEDERGTNVNEALDIYLDKTDTLPPAAVWNYCHIHRRDWQRLEEKKKENNCCLSKCNVQSNWIYCIFSMHTYFLGMSS